MTIYFVFGGVLVAWALIMTALGLTRDDFPRDRSAGRGLIALSGALTLAVLVTLLAVTEKEHPREEAKAKAAEQKAEAGREAGREGGAEPTGGRGGVRTVDVRENEYTIELPAGATLAAAKTKFEVTNAGKIQHDLAVRGPGAEEKTPLIDAGKRATLEAVLKPGRYELICTVPGHEQLGMRTQVTVK
jgi:uncharacterized cupredoxin-like copper-binding protein